MELERDKCLENPQYHFSFVTQLGKEQTKSYSFQLKQSNVLNGIIYFALLHLAALKQSAHIIK